MKYDLPPNIYYSLPYWIRLLWDGRGLVFFFLSVLVLIVASKAVQRTRERDD